MTVIKQDMPEQVDKSTSGNINRVKKVADVLIIWLSPL